MVLQYKQFIMKLQQTIGPIRLIHTTGPGEGQNPPAKHLSIIFWLKLTLSVDLGNMGNAQRTASTTAPLAAASVPAAAPSVTGTFPPTPSRSGKRYYLHIHLHQATDELLIPFISCGSDVALAFLGGSWVGRGQAPRGFADLESAISAYRDITGLSRVVIFTKFIGRND